MRIRFHWLWLLAIALGAAPLTGTASTPVEAVLQQADAIRSSDPRTFRQLLDQLNARNDAFTQAEREHLAYLNAYAAAYSGHYDDAIARARQLVETSRNADMQLRAGSLAVNGYAVTRQFSEGLRQLERNLALIDSVRDPELRQHALGVAAAIYNQIGQYRIGLTHAEQMLSLAPSDRSFCFASGYRFEALQNLGELAAADGSVVEAIGRCARQGEAVVANSMRGTLARAWAKHGRRDDAIALLREYLPEVEATHYPRLVGEIQSLLAELLFARGEFERAETHARAAVAQSAGIANSLPLVTAYRTLYDLALRHHDPVAALDYYRQYAETDKAYLNDVKAREMAYQVVRQETQQKSQQIELLNRQNEVLQLEQRVDRQAAQNTRLLIAFLLLLIASIGFWAYKTKRVQMSLRRMAETDALTGICNRRQFTRLCERSLAQCAKSGEPAALLMFDLDHFKLVNDNHGHETGDWVLKQVASTCEVLCRRIDHFGRLGGEEFAILLHGCDLHAAKRLADDYRLRIASIDTREAGAAFQVTASFGISDTAHSGHDLARLLSHADLMLYRAKREGRNRVCAIAGAQAQPPDGRGAAVGDRLAGTGS